MQHRQPCPALFNLQDKSPMLPIKSGIRHKIIFSILSLVITTTLIFAVVTYSRTKTVLQAEIQKHGIDVVKTFSQMASTYIFENDYVTLLDNARELIQESDILEITALDVNGKVWISTDRHSKKHITIDLFYQDIINKMVIGHRKIERDHQKIIEFVSPIAAIGKTAYLLKIEISLKNMEKQAAQRINEIILITIGMILLATVFGIFLSRLLTQPLDRLVTGTKEISQGNFGYEIPITSRDEIGELTVSFNRMTTIIKQELSKRKEIETKIKRAHDELEQRVEERTRELKKEVEVRLVTEEKYRKLVQASPVPIIVYDMQGNTIYINPAFTHVFGWELNELQGKKINYVPEEEMPKTLEMLKLIRQGKRYSEFETKRYTKDKKLLDVNICFDVWRGHDGLPEGSVVMIHDLTKRKQLESALFQSRKMEAIGTLAGGIAHDFNNILSGIMAFSQLAVRHLDDPDRAKKDIRFITENSKRAARLIQQILTFSRKTEYQKQPIELYAIVKDALELVRSSIPAIIEIKEQLKSKAPVLADPTQMHQVLINLCTNAYHAIGDKNGTITVKLEETSLPERDRPQTGKLSYGTYLKLEVSDTGNGMERAVLEKAFDPYFTTKETGKGTGFGLALVRAIVEEHDGLVTADSIVSEGSSFTVYLPVIKDSEDTHSTELSIGECIGGSEAIMVVDDNQPIREALEDLLSDCGYQVSIFENGIQAFETFKKDPDRFDLVITDMSMPGMAGSELAEKLLAARKDLPIILCTGYNETLTEEKAARIGIRKYIQKPVSNEKITRLIREVLEKRI